MRELVGVLTRATSSIVSRPTASCWCPTCCQRDEIAVLQAGVWAELSDARALLRRSGQASPTSPNTAFSGLATFPWASPELNRLVAHPRLLSIVRQILGIDDIRLYKGELWAKYCRKRRLRPASPPRLRQSHAGGSQRAAAMDAGHDLHLSVRYRRDTTGQPPRCRSGTRQTSPSANAAPSRANCATRRCLACGKAGTALVYSTEVFHRATSTDGARRLAFHRAGRLQGRGRHVDQQAGLRAPRQPPEMIEFVTNVDPDNSHTARHPGARPSLLDRPDHRRHGGSLPRHRHGSVPTRPVADLSTNRRIVGVDGNTADRG